MKVFCLPPVGVCIDVYVTRRLLEDWRKALDNHEGFAAILMDLSKAFDCLPHGLLIAKLRAYGLSEEAVELLESSGLSITRFWGRNSAPFPMPKSMFFSQFQTKNSQFDHKKKKIFFFFFFFFFCSPSSFHIMQILTIKLNCLITNNYIIYLEKGKFNYWNQSSNGKVIHKDDIKFPNFSQNAANFSHLHGPRPHSQKGV